MRRRPRPESAPDEIPDEILAGACLELWAPDEPRTAVDLLERADFLAARRWREAKRSWLDANGFERGHEPVPLRYGCISPYPWSIERPVHDDRHPAALRALTRIP